MAPPPHSGRSRQCLVSFCRQQTMGLGAVQPFVDACNASSRCWLYAGHAGKHALSHLGRCLKPRKVSDAGSRRPLSTPEQLEGLLDAAEGRTQRTMLDLTLHSNPVPVVEGRNMQQTPESALQQLLQQHGAQSLAEPTLQPGGVQAPAATAIEQQNSPTAAAADAGTRHGSSRDFGRRHGRRPSRLQDDEAEASTSDSDAEHWSMSPVSLQRCTRVLPAWHLQEAVDASGRST